MKSNEACRGLGARGLYCEAANAQINLQLFSVSSFALWCFGLPTYRRRSWLMSLEWSMLSLSCVWFHSEFSPFFLCQVGHLMSFFKFYFPSSCGFYPRHSSDQWCDVSILCVCSDCSGSFDWMAHDPEKDLCVGPQLGSPHHCPHH